MKQTDALIKELNAKISPYQSFSLCEKHHLQICCTCLHQGCHYYFKPFCRDCASHPHKNSDIRYLNTNLSKGIITVWEQIKRNYQEFVEIQRNTNINLGYCIDIFNNLRGECIQQFKVTVWPEMVKQTIQLKQEQKNSNTYLKSIQQFTQRYHINWNQYQGKEISPKEVKTLQEELHKNKLRLKHINQFAERALIFSSQISEKQKKFNNKLQKIQSIASQTSLKVTSFNLPLDHSTEVDQLSISLKGSYKNEQNQLEPFISHFNNIKSLEIKSNKVRLKQESWRKLIDHFPKMKFLKELKLHLSGSISYLAQIFQSNYTILRPIGKLHLKISDQKVNVEHIVRICNSFQLSGLWLTLSRCSLTYEQVQYLIKKLKIRTSMTNLPLSDLHLILTINQLLAKQKIQAENMFQKQCGNVQRHTIQL